MVGARVVKRPHESQARFLHHTPGRDVHDHRRCDHPSNVKLSESFLDQRSRALGRIALSPSRSAQPVAELHLVESGSRRRPEMEPTHESPARLLYRSPEAVAGEALVVAQERRQEIALDLLT